MLPGVIFKIKKDLNFKFIVANCNNAKSLNVYDQNEQTIV